MAGCVHTNKEIILSKRSRGSILSDIDVKYKVEPKSPNQSLYLESLQRKTFTFGIGLAGTGKTLLATWQAVLELLSPKNKINRIVVVRPVIGNRFGETFGALPGSILEKMLPYGSSVLDNLSVFLDREAIEKLIDNGYIEFIPLTLLRGRSLNNAFVIVEEAQNIKKSGKGVYMVMSRLGANSKMVFNGDLSQSDLGDEESALREAIDVLTKPTVARGVGVVELYDRQDVQRHPLLHEIMERFGELNDDPF